MIFDLDGVLVDSERLAVRVEAEVLDRLGWPIGEAGVIARFLGRSQRHMHTEVERELGHPIDWDATFGTAHREAFDAELAPIEGVPEVLAALAAADVTVCVASSSTREAIADKLGRTGLAGAFGDRVFSVEDVPREKPAPDVFLRAAATLGVVPRHCAVVEDSLSGVAAGLSAGMAVYAYDGGLVGREQLAGPDVTVFDEMSRLPALLGVVA